jgi:crotonobetainyl-CoA:carnitine CoA-transferase CaiB-like acyl-CoA transferase
MAGALDNVRVVELTTMITGPLAGMLLADLGASVIKIENRESGDPFRNLHGGLYSAHFLCYNRNKRSITLDLRSEKGKSIFFDLTRRADVLVDNFRPGVLDRLGFTHAALTAANPRLIHASITGFGADGPYRDRPAYDAVAQALSGVMGQFLDKEAPQVAGPTISDNITGFYAVYGVLAALYERERTGKGKRIETSMLEATIAFAPDAFLNRKQHGVEIGPLTRVATSQSYAFTCSDDRLLAVQLSSPPKFWEGMLTAIERLDLVKDPRFATRDNRIKNYRTLAAELAKTFITRPRPEWVARLEANDVPYAPVLDVDEVMDDPQVKHLKLFYRTRHPTEGEVWGIHPPLWFDGARPGSTEPPPTVGEHTVEILAELGMSAQEIADLKKGKIV